ncbi:21357_t:CDS:1 [Cetraspora pellucida]|uniref:21357_t:CDS:1 n=1 Tax=Cetraspora pellucida TaxID=1433469 RepID=A0A9N9DHX6_9GLOM|nr:21357_t:CDS:1 [Cetraspora pellucida]
MLSRIKQFEDSLFAIKNQFRKLQQDLVLKEDYIKFLEKEILICNEELDPLHQQISDIKSQLKKVLQTSISQEKYIDYLEEQLVVFQENIDTLDEKIKIISSKRNSPDPYTQSLEEQDINMANLDPIIQID